jgi:membrane-associated protease RseP (regulator of RpoE activity)
MERFGRGPSLAVLLATLAVTCAVAHAASDGPPAGVARLGLAVAQLDKAWRESNAYKSSGVMVVGVDPRGRAAKSGILAGDVLVSVGGHTMREPSDLGYVERSLSQGEAVSVVLAREGGRSIKIFDIAPVGAAPAVAAAAAVAPDSLAADSSAAPDPPAAVDATASASDSASPQAVILAAAAAADSALSPADVAKPSAAADTATAPTASGALVVESELAAGQKSAASGAAPSLTAAGAAGSPTAAGTAAAGSAALAVPAGIAAVPLAAVVVEPGASPAPATAAVDSGGTSPDSAGSAPAELGVTGKSLTPDLATALGASGVEGILVLEVAAASPADRSGLRAGDIILTVGGQPVSDMGELQRAAAASPTPIPISTLRLGKTKVEMVSLDGPPLTPYAPPSQEQLLLELRDEVRSLRREVEGLRKKLGK